MGRDLGPGWSSVVAGVWTGWPGWVASGGGGAALDCGTVLQLLLSCASLVYTVYALCFVSVLSLCSVSLVCVCALYV